MTTQDSDSPYESLSREQLIQLLTTQNSSKSRKHRSTYTQRNALAFRDAFESVIATGNAVLLRYDAYPMVNERTLYNKVTDGLLWLLNNSEGEAKAKWEVFKQSARIKPIDTGILIGMSDIVRKPRGIEVETSVVSNVKDWREDLTRWLEDAPSGEVFHRTGLKLSGDEVESLRQQMSEAGLAFNVTTQVITVSK